MTPAGGCRTGRLVLVTGGVRSGKSAFAEQLAVRLAGPAGGRPAGRGVSPRPVTYVATGRVWDDEMAARVARHQAQRPAGWRTREEPLHLASAVEEACSGEAGVALVDAVDFWVSNRLLEAHPVEGEQLDRRKMAALERSLLEEVDALVEARRRQVCDLILVTLEAGLGVVPPYPLGRAFRDLLGQVNARLAAAADRVFLLVAGLPIDVKQLSAAVAPLDEE